MREGLCRSNHWCAVERNAHFKPGDDASNDLSSLDLPLVLKGHMNVFNISRASHVTCYSLRYLCTSLTLLLSCEHHNCTKWAKKHHGTALMFGEVSSAPSVQCAQYKIGSY